MFNFVKTFLTQYQLETNPYVPALFFSLGLLLLRLIFIALATSQFKNLPKEDRKRLRKHYQKRSVIGWLFWFGAWGLTVMGYYQMLPSPLTEEIYLWPSVGLCFLLSLTAHFLAFALAAVQTLLEKKSLSLVG
jgi:hypothetical protein